MSKAGYEHNTNTGGGIEYYMKNGFVPYPIPEKSNGMHKDGAGMTLDYSYQDWCLAQLAQNLGKTGDYNYFMERSANWKNLFDPSTGWIRPKNVEGKWKEPFDPFEYENGFVEANGAQSTWYVPHDPAGLSELMGGKEKMAQRLDSMFSIAEKLGFTSGTSHAQELHKEYKRIPINYGNQPSTQTAAIFNSIGRPDLSQYWTTKVANTIFSGLSPEKGYNGDEDQGMMGSLAVLMKIGLFELDGGCSDTPRYSITAPAFDQVIIKLNPEYYPGKEFRIIAKNRKENNCYIKSATYNNQDINGVFIKHTDVVNGGELQLELTDKH
jgi:predicted alpha-1,2-mannosidase